MLNGYLVLTLKVTNESHFSVDHNLEDRKVAPNQPRFLYYQYHLYLLPPELPPPRQYPWFKIGSYLKTNGEKHTFSAQKSMALTTRPSMSFLITWLNFLSRFCWCSQRRIWSSTRWPHKDPECKLVTICNERYWGIGANRYL